MILFFHFIINKIMGNSRNKDANVDIYIETDKPFYHGGEWLNGNVYVNAKTFIKYSALYVRLEGHQYCNWQEQHDQNRSNRFCERNIYNNQNIISRFDNGLNKGQYTFPFSMLIHADLPGSYICDGNQNFKIYYSLKAYLVDFTKTNQNQEYTNLLTIIQLFRGANIPFESVDTKEIKSCCCIGRGQSIIKINYPGSYVHAKGQFPVTVTIDNTHCKQDIKSVDIVVNRHLYATDLFSNAFRNWPTTQSIQPTKPVSSGTIQNSQISVRIPDTRQSTALGQLTGLYFEVKAIPKYGGCTCCCANEPSISTPIFIEAINPEIYSNQKQDPPLGWNPVVANKVICETVVPYKHTPNPNLSVMNR